MKSELIEVTPTQKRLVFEIPSQDVEQAVVRAARQLGRQARIPGFRPGKAPERVIRQRYRDQILHDVMHELIPRSLDEALRERALDPVETPDVADVVLKEGEPLTFTATFETVPPVPEVDYLTLTLRRSPIQVGDEAVTAMMERLRERAARFEPVEDRGSVFGDTLTVDVVRRVLGPAGGSGGDTLHDPETHTDVHIEVGNAVNPPGFDAEILDMRPGDRRTFMVTFPPGYEVAELADSRVEYQVALKTIKRKVLPALDDEFAKDLGEFSSLEELRTRVTEDIRREGERSQEREIRADLLRQLASHVTFEVPEPLVEKELDRRMQDLVGRMLESGVDPEKARFDWQEFRASQRQPATDTVKSVLMLDDISRRDGITVSDEDLDREVSRLADRTGRSAALVRAKLEEDGGLTRVATGLRRDRTVEYVMSRATIVTV